MVNKQQANRYLIDCQRDGNINQQLLAACASHVSNQRKKTKKDRNLYGNYFTTLQALQNLEQPEITSVQVEITHSVPISS